VTICVADGAVPLCGDSVDLTYLASLGLKVVGVELVESAVRKIEVDVEKCPLQDSGRSSGEPYFVVV
jgi:Thiopurine S-methyltransferase (TPMT)